MVEIRQLMRALNQRLRALWQEKLLLTLALNLVFWVPYCILARRPFFPLWTVPETFLDRAIPFQPGWTVVYCSEYLITFLVPWLIIKKRDLHRYALGMLLMSGICFTLFFVVPTASPRPTSVTEESLYQIILLLDGPLNAFPSLHAAFLSYTLPIARPWVRQPVFLAILLWAVAILYATVATRQHFTIDLIAGAVIGYTSYRLCWQADSKAAPEIRPNETFRTPAGSK